MKILGIETSCDETGVAVLDFNIQDSSFGLLSSELFSQIRIHKKYGGIVPEVAARDHVLKIIPILNKALHSAKVKISDIDFVCYTKEPGLITSLMVGKNTAEALAFALGVPVLGINHIFAHMLSFLLQNGKGFLKLENDTIILVVSGGHTQLYLLQKDFSYKLLGETLDDAAGEAFDKIAKIMGLDYPGGPLIEKYAKDGDADAYQLPRPMIHSKDLNFSFSGLKTAVLYLAKGIPLKKETYRGVKKKSAKSRGLSMNKKNVNNLSASVQKAIVDVLVYKTQKAVEKYNIKQVAVVGGVSANNYLKQRMIEYFQDQDIKVFFPEKQFCTDNAAMVTLAGAFNFLQYDKV